MFLAITQCFADVQRFLVSSSVVTFKHCDKLRIFPAHARDLFAVNYVRRLKLLLVVWLWLAIDSLSLEWSFLVAAL